MREPAGWTECCGPTMAVRSILRTHAVPARAQTAELLVNPKVFRALYLPSPRAHFANLRRD
jgi:hypothetical protein